MIILKNYTAEEVQQMLNKNRDIILGHRERKIHIEFSETKLDTELSAKDGVFIAPNHTAKVKDYLCIKTKKDGKAYATPSTNSRLASAGIEGMTGKQLKALLGKLGGKLIDKEQVPVPEKITEQFLNSMTLENLKIWIREKPKLADYVDMRKTKADIIKQVMEFYSEVVT